MLMNKPLKCRSCTFKCPNFCDGQTEQRTRKPVLVPITTNVVSLNPGSWKGVLATTLCDKVCQ